MAFFLGKLKAKDLTGGIVDNLRLFASQDTDGFQLVAKSASWVNKTYSAEFLRKSARWIILIFINQCGILSVTA